MIISRTPFRVSFFGGGTDYPAFFEQEPGAVLSTSIDKYCFLTCRWLPPFFPYRYRVVYRTIEEVRTIEEIQHPVVREVLRHLAPRAGIEIHYDADLPSRTGIGSSSSFTVCLLHAVSALVGEMKERVGLAREAIHLEQKRLGENVGSQDQTAAAVGGLNRIDFLPGGELRVERITIRPERKLALQDQLMLFFTGMSRNANEIAGEQIRNTPARLAELRAMRGMVGDAVQLLAGDGDLSDFGRLLHESWQLKRSLSSRVTTSEIDAVYERARDAGAIGGKLLGAGGGGFLLLFVEPGKQAMVRRRLGRLVHVPFGFEDSGSQILFYQPNEPIAPRAARMRRPARSTRPAPLPVGPSAARPIALPNG